jgi:hypothetical protein
MSTSDRRARRSSGSTPENRRTTDPIIERLGTSAPWAFGTLVLMNAADLLRDVIARCG